MKLCPKCQKQFSDDANFCPVDAARLVALEAVAESSVPDPLAARFELGEQLGGGRTGAVHRATEKATGQAVAVKIVAPAVVALPGLAQRLERELKQLERVQSHCVARVLASGKRGDDPWVAMELLENSFTLGEAVAERGPMPAEHAARLIDVVGEALIEAAQVGVVHRDLAPKNILFCGDELKLVNFSLPVPSNDKAPGVPEFVAPEQHDGKPVDQRSNLYSLGALYYFVLAGQPVSSDDNGVIKPPSAFADVPPAVEAVILRALDRSPTKRFLTVRQFIDEVGRIARGEVDRSSQPLGRTGRLAAEVVDTPSGSPPMATMLGVGTPASASSDPSTAAGSVRDTVIERSPWAPPATETGAAQVAAPAIAAAPAAPVPAAPLVPAAPVVPVPLMAAPLLARKSGGSEGDAKGRFRETLWFKKGELDAQAAQAAAEEHAKTGKIVSDKADQLPLDERYKDDGTVQRADKEKYSLRTGVTTSITAVREPASHTGSNAKVSEDALIGEMKGGRNKVLAIALAVFVALVILVLVAR